MIYEYKGIRPKLGRNVFLAPGVVVLGDVEIGDDSNIWFNTIVRGDVHSIRIGKRSNIQDLCMLHVTGEKYPLSIGDDVVVGHRAVLHGCTVNSNALIGIGALVLDGAVIENGAIVAAGAVVPPGMVVRADTMVAGVPAKVMRERTDAERDFHKINIEKYAKYASEFLNITKIHPDNW